MPKYTLTPQQVALYTIARTTWGRRRKAKSRGSVFSEETITQTILMDLEDIYPGDLKIVQFNKNEEGENGADWAWLFRDVTGSQNIPMLVQAKVLDFADDEYPEIKRTIGKKIPKVRQIDRLIETAGDWGWPAIYAFYNHVSVSSRIPDICRTLPFSSDNPEFFESWGISIASAYWVRDSLDDQTFDTHREHSIPLHCMLCSGATGSLPPGGSPELLRTQLDRLNRRGAGSGPLAPAPVFGEMPELFRAAINAAADLAGSTSSSALDSVAERYPTIAGVAIFQDGKGESRVP